VADERFLRGQRIRLGRDFLLFRASKVRGRGRGFLIVNKSGVPGGRPRIAIVTSKKTGGAVRRNALRRMVRDSFRHIQWQLSPNSDWMIVFLPPSKGMALEDLKIPVEKKMLKMSCCSN
jgi:ribonuclease P protein component